MRMAEGIVQLTLKNSYPNVFGGSVDQYGVFIILVSWVHSMVEPCGRVSSRCSLLPSLISGILQANLHIKPLVMRLGNVVSVSLND